MHQPLVRRSLAPALMLFLSCALQAQDRTEFHQGHEVAAQEVLVKFRATTPQSLAQALFAQDIDRVEGVGGTGVLLLHSRSKGAGDLVRGFSAHPDAEYAEPNYILHAVVLPNDPSFGQLWGLQNTGQSILGQTGTPGADIKAVSAWDLSTGSRANVVTVVDTGIDYTHPDLAANVWSAPNAFTVTIGTRTITCAAGTHGFNAITNSCDPLDDNNHGTHVSGTIGALGNNSVGVVGVNWTASILGSKFLNAAGSGTTSNAINAIEFAIQTKAAFPSGGANVVVLSNSWGGGGFSQSLLNEIKKANTNGMLFVAAAGNNSSNNDTTPFYPADYNSPNVIAVAATDNNDALASFSNYGPTTVHLGAPGVSVLSTIIGGNYDYFSGTSMATPHVSGSAALVLSLCALDTAGVKSNLLNNVDPIPSLNGLTITGGRLNVNKAIRACSAPATPDFSISASPASQTVTQGINASYTVSVTASGGFTAAVTFSVSGLPAGATASFNPTSVTGSGNSTLTVTTGSSTPAGTYTLTIAGTSGSLQHTTTVTLVVSAPAAADFSLSASPGTRVVNQGGSASYTVSVTASGGFAGTVTFSVSGLPAGASATFNPTSVNGSGSSTLTVNTGTASVGTSALTIAGTSGSLQHTASVSLKIK